MSQEHIRTAEALGAWALDACPRHEADQVEAHAATCPECAAEARRLVAVTGALAAEEAVSPPAGLRERVRAGAFGRRAPSALPRDPLDELPDATGSYIAAVGSMDALLDELTPVQWQSRVLRDWNVQQLLDHLAASDRSLASQLLPAARASAGAPEAAAAGAEGARASWRAQAGAMLDHVGAGQAGVRPVHLANPELPRQPVGYALVQRTFETWIHADDIRTGLGRPTDPPPTEHLRLVAELGVRLLPVALRRLGRESPGRSARLVLDGGGEHAWTLPLAVDTLPGTPDVTLRMDLGEFCYLMGNRREPASVACAIQGERSLGFDLLVATSTLGCD